MVDLKVPIVKGGDGKAFHMEISFHSYTNKTIFHIKSFKLSLAFIMRLEATRKCLNFIALFKHNFCRDHVAVLNRVRV